MSPTKAERIYRTALFLVGCIGARAALAYAAFRASPSTLRLLGFLALGPATGFAYLYASGTRRSGPETFGEPIWWNSLRPVHAAMYAAFAASAIRGSHGRSNNSKSQAWMWLAIDAAIGLAAYIAHRAALFPI